MLTLAEPVDVEIPKVKGSRFLAYATPIRDKNEFDRWVEGLHRLHRKASHIATGWRMSDREHGSSDDGEVSGTAGPPILARLEGQDAVRTGAAVVRYYGGTNLGKGGLVRSYGAAAAAVLAAGDWLPVVPHQRVQIRAPSAFGAAVMAEVQRAGLQVEDAVWDVELRLVTSGPTGDVERLEARVRAAARGDLDWKVEDL